MGVRTFSNLSGSMDLGLLSPPAAISHRFCPLPKNISINTVIVGEVYKYFSLFNRSHVYLFDTYDLYRGGGALPGLVVGSLDMEGTQLVVPPPPLL